MIDLRGSLRWQRGKFFWVESIVARLLALNDEKIRSNWPSTISGLLFLLWEIFRDCFELTERIFVHQATLQTSHPAPSRFSTSPAGRSFTTPTLSPLPEVNVASASGPVSLSTPASVAARKSVAAAASASAVSSSSSVSASQDSSGYVNMDFGSGAATPAAPLVLPPPPSPVAAAAPTAKTTPSPLEIHTGTTKEMKPQIDLE